MQMRYVRSVHAVTVCVCVVMLVLVEGDAFDGAETANPVQISRILHRASGSNPSVHQTINARIHLSCVHAPVNHYSRRWSYLAPFRRYCRFSAATLPLFYAKFGGAPLGLDCRCWGSEEWRLYRLIVRLINLFNPTYTTTVPYLSVTNRQADGQTDSITIHNVHCAVKTNQIKSHPLGIK